MAKASKDEFLKQCKIEVKEMRQSKMAEWMENVEKAIYRIMADKVYTSPEFKHERDTFNALCKDLECTKASC